MVFKPERLYPDSYFAGRLQNDSLRIQAFRQDEQFMARFVGFDGTCLDVGCSTGEFLNFVGWSGQRIGIEISSFAAEMARQKGFQIVESVDQVGTLDVVIYRGTIQHLDSPFRSLAKAYSSLRPGGHLFFLATPNIDSLTYRLLSDLPALDSARNFFLPGRAQLYEICVRLGFQFSGLELPYWRSPYRKLVRDHLHFLESILLKLIRKDATVDFAFWGSMMNMAFRKPV